MEEILETQRKIEERELKDEKEIKESKKKKSFTICGITIWRLMAYFIIYSIAGFIIETIFGAVTKGVIESRKSFLYGPFCAIYGVGAVVMIIGLQHFKKNNYTLFLGGFIIGSVVEYIVSWVGEMIFHVMWWDYSTMPFNINGRICVAFSFFWGVLAIYLMSHINPKVDKLIDKMLGKFKAKPLKILALIGVILMFIDWVITGFALKMFYVRLADNYNLELKAAEEYIMDVRELYQNEDISNFVYRYFSDEKMLKTFPNLKLMSKDGEIIYISDVLKDIQPYYVRIFTPVIPKKLTKGE